MLNLEDRAGLDVRLWAPANKSLKLTAAAHHYRAPPSGNPDEDGGARGCGRRPQLSSESLAGRVYGGAEPFSGGPNDCDSSTRVHGSRGCQEAPRGRGDAPREPATPTGAGKSKRALR